MFRSAQHDNGRSVASPRVVNIEDLRRAAKRRLPQVVFDYIDGGAEDERTLRANCRAFEDVTFRPRCAIETPACDLRVSVLGQSLSMPLILAPVGSSRLMYPRGEEAAAGAAGRAPAPGPGGRHPTDVPARGGRRRWRRWRRRHCLCAFDALRMSLGGCCR